MSVDTLSESAIVLVTHGHSRRQQSTPAPVPVRDLTRQGVLQSECFARWIVEGHTASLSIDVWTSSTRRTMRTAEVVKRVLEGAGRTVTPIQSVNRLGRTEDAGRNRKNLSVALQKACDHLAAAKRPRLMILVTHGVLLGPLARMVDPASTNIVNTTAFVLRPWGFGDLSLTDTYLFPKPAQPEPNVLLRVTLDADIVAQAGTSL